LLVLAFAPTPASAACSATHAVSFDPREHLSQLHDLGALTAPDVVPVADRRPPAQVPVPACSGPGCSSKSGLPPVSASVSSPRVQSDWALVVRPTPDPRPAGAPGIPAPLLSPRLLCADRIFHPPRGTVGLSGLLPSASADS